MMQLKMILCYKNKLLKEKKNITFSFEILFSNKLNIKIF